MTNGGFVSNGWKEIVIMLKSLIITKFIKRGVRMKRLPNIHPGEVLEEEFIKPLSLSAYRLAKETKIPQTRISEIIKGRRRISADTALRLAKFFGNTPQFWLGLQNDYDLEESQKFIARDLEEIHPLEELRQSSNAVTV
jgi:addiction module HigA family antidote